MMCKMRCQNLRSDLSMYGIHAGVMTPPIVLLGNCFQVFVFGLVQEGHTIEYNTHTHTHTHQSGLRNTDGLVAHRWATIQPTDGLLH